VVTKRVGVVEIVRIDRPEARNAVDPETAVGLVEAFEAAAADEAVRVVLLTGTGDRAFCAGMDLKAFSQGAAGSAESRSRLMSFIRDASYEKPIIAVVNGPAAGLGFELALTADLIVAADSAWFALPEVSRGLFAAGGGTFLPWHLPLHVALELGLTGSRLSVERALALGLVNRAVPFAELESAALELAAAIAANGPLGVRATKLLMRETALRDPQSLWAQVDEYRAEVFTSSDAKEGATAFLERRTPTWTGH